MMPLSNDWSSLVSRYAAGFATRALRSCCFCRSAATCAAFTASSGGGCAALLRAAASLLQPTDAAAKPTDHAATHALAMAFMFSLPACGFLESRTRRKRLGANVPAASVCDGHRSARIGAPPATVWPALGLQ